MGPLYPPPRFCLPELEKIKLVTPLHLPPYAHSTITSAVTFPVLEQERTKQKVGMETTRLTTPPHL